MVMETAVVLARSRGDLLVGYGGKYIKDIKEHADAVKKDSNTGVPETEPQDKALPIVRERRAKWEGIMREPVKYTPLYRHEAVWKSIFFIKDDNKFGFPKGGFYPRQETPRQAAAREFREETGFAVPEAELVATREPNVFIFNVSDKQRTAIIDAWQRLGLEGELFEVHWEPEASVRRKKLNKNSEEALKVLAGGRRTLRRRFTRKTRRHLK